MQLKAMTGTQTAGQKEYRISQNSPKNRSNGLRESKNLNHLIIVQKKQLTDAEKEHAKVLKKNEEYRATTTFQSKKWYAERDASFKKEAEYAEKKIAAQRKLSNMQAWAATGALSLRGRERESALKNDLEARKSFTELQARKAVIASNLPLYAAAAGMMRGGFQAKAAKVAGAAGAFARWLLKYQGVFGKGGTGGGGGHGHLGLGTGGSSRSSIRRGDGGGREAMSERFARLNYTMSVLAQRSGFRRPSNFC